MILTPRLRQGVKAAVPVWIAFIPSSIAWGIAAQAHGLRLDEILLMSAWVYSGPAQFAVLAPLASGKPALQVILAASLVNLRFLPMSTALAPFFKNVRRRRVFCAAHFISASSFIIPYLQFQKEKESPAFSVAENNGRANIDFFLGVGVTSFAIWVAGSAAGFEIAHALPQSFDEGLRFILPGYFAGLITMDLRSRTMAAICLSSLILTVPAIMWSPDWGWIVITVAIATAGWSFETWTRRA
jgi:predicted branched-subunit amino acid permease